jgi:hypothetical protein
MPSISGSLNLFQPIDTFSETGSRYPPTVSAKLIRATRCMLAACVDRSERRGQHRHDFPALGLRDSPG